MIAIVDYKAGNLTSVKRALDHLGIEAAHVVGERPRGAPSMLFHCRNATTVGRGLDQSAADQVGVPADRAEGPHRRVDAAGYDLGGALEQLGVVFHP